MVCDPALRDTFGRTDTPYRSASPLASGKNKESNSYNDREIYNFKTVSEALKGINPAALTAEDRKLVLENYHISGAKLRDYLSALKAITGLSVSKSAYYAWDKAFYLGGIEALSDNRGANNRKIDTEILKEAVKAAAVKRITNVFETYKLLLAKKEGKTITGWISENPVSLTAVYRAVDKLIATDRDTALYLRGADIYENQIPHVRRAKIARNNEWQIDASPFDFFCLKQVQVWDSKNQIMRLETKQVRATVIMIIDHYSGRRICGLYESPNSYANVRLLKKALLTFGGKPKFLRGDNGADYLSKHFQTAIDLLGITYVKSRKFTGYDKGAVERAFRTLFHGRLELLPGEIGHNVKERAQIEAISASKAERISGAATQTQKLLAWGEIEALLDAYIEEEDERLGHIKKWNENVGEIVAVEEYEINRAIGKRFERVWQTTGALINGVEYTNIYLAHLIGKKILIAENVNDISRVWLFDPASQECVGYATNSEVRRYSVEEVRAVQKARTKDLRAARKASAKIKDELSDEIVSGIYGGRIREKIAAAKKAVILKEESQEIMDAINRPDSGLLARIEKRLLKSG
jgi:transposase InsO family protein